MTKVECWRASVEKREESVPEVAGSLADIVIGLTNLYLLDQRDHPLLCHARQRSEYKRRA